MSLHLNLSPIERYYNFFYFRLSIFKTTQFQIGIFFSLLSISNTAHSSSLTSLYESAMSYDAQYAAAHALLNASIEKKPQALAGLLPTLSLSANSTWINQDTTLRTSEAQTITNRYNDKGWSAQLTQPIFRWQNIATYKQANIFSIRAEIEFQKAGQDLMLKVSKAYFDVLIAMEKVATDGAQLHAIREQLDAAKRGYALGVTTITDTHEAQARYELQTAAGIASSNDLSIKKKILENISGPYLKILPKGFQRPLNWKDPSPSAEEAWTNAAYSNNLEVKLGESAFEIASHEVEKKRSNHLPTIDLVGNYDSTTYSATLSNGIERPGSEIHASSVGLQMRIPLYSGGAMNSQTREALALCQKTLDELVDAKRRSMLSAQESFRNVTAGLAQISAYEAALTSSEAAVKANKRGYELGMRLNIDVLNAQSQMFDTKQKLLQARFDTLLSQLKLKAAAGILQYSDLSEIDNLLEEVN